MNHTKYIEDVREATSQRIYEKHTKDIDTIYESIYEAADTGLTSVIYDNMLSVDYDAIVNYLRLCGYKVDTFSISKITIQW